MNSCYIVLLAISIFLHVYWPSEAASDVMWPSISEMALHNHIDSCAIPISSAPICIKKILERRDMYRKRPTGRQFMSERRRNACQLLHYTPKDATICIDILNKDIKESDLHFVFIGDSRIRQHFQNFLKIIPQYDLKSGSKENLNLNHQDHTDVSVTSNILNVQISYFWDPLITNDTVKIMHILKTYPPYFILLGISAHYMLTNNGGNHEIYEKKLIELSSLVGQLNDTTQVFWLNQYPTIDFYGRTHDHNTDIFAKKIHQYNEMSRRILEKQKGIRIWDSGNPLAEEYVRSCAFAKRRPSKNDSLSYFNCGDYIHTGYAALSDATQILFNDICNGPILKHACSL